MILGNFQTLSATIVIESLFSGHENVFGNVNASGLARTWNVTAISWARSSGIKTCNHEPWATKGCSESTNVPVTECATNVIAVSPRTDLKVKWRPCLTRPLENKNFTKEIFQVLFQRNYNQKLCYLAVTFFCLGGLSPNRSRKKANECLISSL